MEQLQIDSLLIVAREHKKSCADADCGVSMMALGMVYKSLVKRELTPEENSIFC